MRIISVVSLRMRVDEKQPTTAREGNASSSEVSCPFVVAAFCVSREFHARDDDDDDDDDKRALRAYRGDEILRCGSSFFSFFFFNFLMRLGDFRSM